MIDNRQQGELTFWVNNLIEFSMMSFFSVDEIWRAHKSGQSSHISSQKATTCVLYVVCLGFDERKTQQIACRRDICRQSHVERLHALLRWRRKENEHKCYDSIQWDLNAAINHVQLVMAAHTLELRLTARWYHSQDISWRSMVEFFGIWFSVFFLLFLSDFYCVGICHRIFVMPN